MNITFKNDIIIIDNAFPDELCDLFANKILSMEDECVSIHNIPELLDPFNEYWYSTLEKIFMKTWLFLKEDGTSSLYKYTKVELETIQNYAKTVWRDLYVLNYKFENTSALNDMIHSDFSNYTFSCGLIDSNNFEGGEVVFPRQDFKIKINKGQMIIFPGGLTHPHYTSGITSGRRLQFIGQSMPQQQDHGFGEDHDR